MGPSLLTVKGERHMGTNFMQSLLQHFFPQHTRAIPLHGSLYSACNSSAQPGSVGSYDPHLCCSKHGMPNAGCRLGRGAPPVYVLLLRNPYACDDPALPNQHAVPGYPALRRASHDANRRALAPVLSAEALYK